jgi:hypothetical protein
LRGARVAAKLRKELRETPLRAVMVSRDDLFDLLALVKSDVVVTLTITDDAVESDFPNVSFACDGEFVESVERAVHNVRGSCLHAIGDRNTIAERLTIEFKTVDKRSNKEG